MSLWVKVCGLTTEAAVTAALAAQVDAVGFVFAPSKRRVSAAQAARLTERVPSHVARVAVMLHPLQAEVDEVWSVFRPDVLQTDVADFSSLTLPHGLQTMPVVRGLASVPAQLPGRLLFEGPTSGIGVTADWTLAKSLARRTELVLAGGLHAGNVADAVATVRPFGVDVSSGVEREPGIKDVDKIAHFVAAARAAANE